jgi:hypothetical protein
MSGAIGQCVSRKQTKEQAMSISKKSLISNRSASKKAIVTKPEVTSAEATKVMAGPHKVMAGPHKVMAGPHKVMAGPHKVMAGPHKVMAGPHKVAAGPHKVMMGN